MSGAPGADTEETLGRYALHGELASGGMATVHLGRLVGPAGFARTVAIKRLHPPFARDPQFVAMFLDEARLAARLRHKNVVPILDVVSASGELLLVMDYIHGESVSRLAQAARARAERIDPAIAVAIAVGLLDGLHAAHEAIGEGGEPLGLVHRDVSPQNVMVGVDGVARVLDFGVAKARGRLQTTEEGQLKGKTPYMAPEVLLGEVVDRRSDVWAAAVVLWELLSGRSLFVADAPGATVQRILSADVAPPGAGAALDAVVMKGLARAPAERFATAREMAVALEAALTPATPRVVGEWVERLAADALAGREQRTRELESSSTAAREVDLARDLGGTRPIYSEESTAVVPVRGVGAPPPAVAPGGAAASTDAPEATSGGTTTLEVRPDTGEPAAASNGAARVIVAIALVAALALGVHFVRRAATPSQEPALRPAPSTTAVDARREASTAPSASEPPPRTGEDAATPSVSDAGGEPTAKSARRPTVKAPPTPPPKAPPGECDPPFRWIDGIKVPKRECL